MNTNGSILSGGVSRSSVIFRDEFRQANGGCSAYYDVRRCSLISFRILDAYSHVYGGIINPCLPEEESKITLSDTSCYQVKKRTRVSLSFPYK
jgi:hypothetical protein